MHAHSLTHHSHLHLLQTLAHSHPLLLTIPTQDHLPLQVCAPRFNDLHYEAEGRAFLIGRCVSGNLNVRTEEFYPLNRNEYYKKVSLGNGISKYILWNGMGQSGMSGDAMAVSSLPVPATTLCTQNILSI